MNLLTRGLLAQAIQEQALLVCIDVEAHCFNVTRVEHLAGMRTNRRRICEIGIDFVDTTEIKEDDLGDRATNLMKYHRPHEFVIREARHDPKKSRCHPSGFCKVGAPENFLFGHPKYIGKAEIANTILDLVRSYAGSTERKIVFLFYARSNDLIWLVENGIVLEDEFENFDIIDIQKCRPAITIARVQGAHGVPHLGARHLYPAIGIPTENKHNGGNDAAFELQAWLAESTMTEEDFQILANGGRLEPLLPKM